MDLFNVHWKLGERKGRNTMTAFNKEDAKFAFQQYARHDGNIHNIPFEAEVVKVIGPLGRPQSPKQKLAQKYGFLMGSIIGAEKQFGYFSRMNLPAGIQPNTPQAAKIHRAVALVESQFAKLKRDISDTFKLAGLKVK